MSVADPCECFLLEGAGAEDKGSKRSDMLSGLVMKLKSRGTKTMYMDGPAKNKYMILLCSQRVIYS